LRSLEEKQQRKKEKNNGGKNIYQLNLQHMQAQLEMA